MDGFVEILLHVLNGLIKVKQVAPDTETPALIKLFSQVRPLPNAFPSAWAEQIGRLTFNDVKCLAGSTKSVADLAAHPHREANS